MKSQNPLIKQIIKKDQNPKAIDPNGKMVTELQLELVGFGTIKALDRRIMVRRVSRSFSCVRYASDKFNSKLRWSKRLIGLLDRRGWSTLQCKVKMRERERCDEMRKRDLRWELEVRERKKIHNFTHWCGCSKASFSYEMKKWGIKNKEEMKKLG